MSSTPRARTRCSDTVRRAAKVDVFASTHTCLAALRDFALGAGRLTVINNGAAGMPNFSGSRFGLVSRIGTSPSPHRPLYGMERDGVHIDAIALHIRWGCFPRPFPRPLAAGLGCARILLSTDHCGAGPHRLASARRDPSSGLTYGP